MNSLRHIVILTQKDLKDAIRDARVLIALVVPLGIGLFYGFTFDDSTTTTIRAQVGVFTTGNTGLIDALRSQLPANVIMRTRAYPNQAGLTDDVGGGTLDIGLVVPAGFDRAIANGAGPTLTILSPPDGSLSGDYVLSALDPAVRAMAGQSEPVQFDVQHAQRSTSGDLATRLGVRTWSLLLALIMTLGLVSILAIPIVLVEEVEKKTIDALILAMNYWEVVAAKSLLGVIYIVVMTTILVRATGLTIVHTGLFVLAMLGTTLALLGMGLLMGGLFKSANQLNTWAGVLLGPVIAPAFIPGTPLPHMLQTIAGLCPPGAAMKLLANAVSHEQIFHDNALSIVVLVFWSVVIYALLIARLNRLQR
jgi:ABC-2 type transport system permease protein